MVYERASEGSQSVRLCASKHLFFPSLFFLIVLLLPLSRAQKSVKIRLRSCLLFVFVLREEDVDASAEIIGSPVKPLSEKLKQRSRGRAVRERRRR